MDDKELIKVLNEKKKEIEQIINNALEQYQIELDNSKVDKWSFESQKSYIESTFEKHRGESYNFIFKNFPDSEKNINNQFSKLIRYELTRYALERDNEFENIRFTFSKKLNNKSN